MCVRGYNRSKDLISILHVHVEYFSLLSQVLAQFKILISMADKLMDISGGVLVHVYSICGKNSSQINRVKLN